MEERIDNLRRIIQKLQCLAAVQEAILHNRVNEIVARCSVDIYEIDHLMNDL